MQTTLPKKVSQRFNKMIIQPSSRVPVEEHRDARLVTWLALVTVVALILRLMFGMDLLILTGIFVVAIAYALSRTRYRQIAGLIIVSLLAAPTFANLINLSPVGTDIGEWVVARVIWLALPLALASVFFAWRGTFLYGLALFISLTLLPVLKPDLAFNEMAGALGFVGTLTILLTVAVNHRDLVERDRQTLLVEANQALKESEATLEKRVVERTKELEIARLEAEQANRVKSQFLASMSHELRTPLNSIINFAKFVYNGVLGEINDEQKDVLGKVVFSAEHLLNLINDVLDISKIEAGALQLFIEDTVDLPSELENIQAMAVSLVKDKPVEIHLEVTEDLPAIRGDQQRIRQILLNLVSNACKFTDEGQVTIQAALRNEEVMIVVKDTGPGIPPTDHEQIFETFRQSETGLRKGTGTGLGLPISRRLAEAHGGRLWMESKPGDGSVFYVALPVRNEALSITAA